MSSISARLNRYLPLVCKALSLAGTLLVSGNANASLVAHYTFDGDANDSSGNAYHATVSGPTLTADRYGDVSSAYSFTGSPDQMQVGDTPALRLNNTDYTLAAWVFEAQESTHYTHTIASKRGNGAQDGWLWGISGQLDVNGPRKLELIASGGIDPKVYSTGTIALNTWQHVALTYSLATQTVSMFINGVLDSTHAGFATLNGLTAQDLFIGADPHTAPFAWQGALDDIRIYDHALSATEVANLASSSISSPTTVLLLSLVLAFMGIQRRIIG